MGSSYLPPPEQNVVNVGEELSQTALDAINAATFPSGSNPFRTTNEGEVISAYDNFKVYQAGEIVTLGGLIYVFNTPIGAAGYDPINHPNAWTSMQGQQGQQGQQGPQGPQGDQGPVGDQGMQGQIGHSTIAWMGPWSGGSYSSGDIVSYDGTSWAATQSSFNALPSSNPSYWQLVAEKGQNGDMGPPGANGADGPMGPSGQAISVWNSGYSYIKNDIVFDPNDLFVTPYIATALNVNNTNGTPAQNYWDWQRLGSGLYVTNEAFNSSLASYSQITGTTFTGKVNITPSATTAPLNLGSQQAAPSTTMAGDFWIGVNINYKSWDGVTKAVANTNTTNTFTQAQVISNSGNFAALRITQVGTGPTLVVEDFTTPDTSSFVVNADGNVGIGVAAGYTATQKLEVVGNVKADSFVNGTGPVFKVNSVTTHSGGAHTHDIFMSLNGSTYRIPAVFVSTP